MGRVHSSTFCALFIFSEEATSQHSPTGPDAHLSILQPRPHAPSETTVAQIPDSQRRPARPGPRSWGRTVAARELRGLLNCGHSSRPPGKTLRWRCRDANSSGCDRHPPIGGLSRPKGPSGHHSTFSDCRRELGFGKPPGQRLQIARPACTRFPRDKW